MDKLTEKFGTVKIRVEEVRLARKMSKNELCYRAEVQRTQLNRYCAGTVTRLDTDVLIRLCYALDCSLGDLLEYVPPAK